MRITLITSKLNFKTAGGSVFDLHLKAEGLKRLGHDVTVITVFSQNNIIEEPLSYKVQEENILARGLLGIQKGGVKILRKYERETDAYYIDGQIFIYAAGWYRMTGGKTPIISFFNTRINCMGDTQNVGTKKSWVIKEIKRKLRYILERCLGTIIANQADYFIINTPHLQNIYKNFGLVIEKSAVIEDFVDTTTIINEHGITEERIIKNQERAEKINLFTTGRMIHEKGFDLVIKAFSGLREKEKYNLTICGSGPDEERLKKMVEDLGLIDHVAFPGWVTKEELNSYFLDAHVFIFPKWWIEYGSVLLTEAMAFGLPSVVPAGGALAWLTKNSALTFESDNVLDMVFQIEKLAHDISLRIQLGKNGLARAKDLDSKELTKRLEQILISVSKSAI